jgi:predicted nuclease with TOPRIM domain
VSKGISSHLMKPGAQRRKSRAQIQEEKLQEQQKEATIAEKMRRFEQMEQEISAAHENLNSMSGMKVQIDQMFEHGYIVKNPDGSLGLANSEE